MRSASSFRSPSDRGSHTHRRTAALSAIVATLAFLTTLAVDAQCKPFPRLSRRIYMESRDDRPLVDRLMFAGNETFDESTLALYVQTRESGFLSPYRYDRRTLMGDLENLKRFYASRGFLEADVRLEDLAVSADSTRVEILVGIYEGDRWYVDSIAFSGNADLTDEELSEATKLREGEPFQQNVLAGDRRRILDEYARRSYLDARVEQTVERDDTERTAGIAYDIVEREPAVIADIDVVGDEKTRQFVVERELTFSVGERFDFAKIGESQANIYRTGLFNSVWIEPAPDDTGRAQKSVIVRVQERPSGDVDFTAGYAVVDGFEVGSSFINRNVQGQATTLGLEGTYSERSREARASVGDPWFFGRRVAVETAARYQWSSEESFLAETNGASLVLSKELGLNLTLEGGYEYERTAVLESSDEEEGTGVNYTSDVLFAAVFDSRDDVMGASRGMFARGQIDFASSRLGGTNDFVRVDLDWRGYLKVSHGRVGAMELRLGWVRPQGDGSSVPVNERYFAGGEGTVRGFARSSLGPVDGNGEARGGRAIVVARAEARFPVYKKLRGAVFVDAGDVFTDLAATALSDLSVGAGGGLRFETRIGVLRFDAATPVSESGEPHYYFGIGQAF